MKKIFTFVLIFAYSVSFSQEKEEKNPILTDKYQFGVGLFFPSKTIDLSVNGSDPNEEFEFGKSFGFNDSQTTLFLGFDWHFSQKWKISFEYFGISNAKKKVLAEDIIWDDIVFRKGSNVKAGINFNLYRIYAGRAFIQKQKHEFGAGIGFHAMNVGTYLEGEVYVNDEEDLSFQRSKKTITLPLPNLGLWYYYAPTSKLALTTRLDVFALSIGDYSGSLWNITPGIQYQAFRNVGIAVNYRYVNIGAKFDTEDWDGKLDIAFKGPSFTITGNF